MSTLSVSAVDGRTTALQLLEAVLGLRRALVVARGRLPGALSAGLELLGGGLLLAGEPLVVGRLALEALGLRAVLVGALEALLGLLPGLARAGGVGLELLTMAAGLGAQALAGALALDAAPRRGAVGEPCRDGDDGD